MQEAQILQCCCGFGYAFQLREQLSAHTIDKRGGGCEKESGQRSHISFDNRCLASDKPR